MAKSNLTAFIVFYGLEDYLLDREMQKGKAWADRLVSVFDGTVDSEETVLSALQQFTLDGSGVAVVLDNANKLKVGKAFKEHLESQDPKDTSSVLVAIHRCAELPKSWSGVVGKSRVVEHKKYKPWEKDLIKKRVKREADRLKIGLKDDAFDVLHRVYKDDTRSMVNEVQKLSFLVNVGSDITKAQVLSVCRKQLSIQPWDVVELASNKLLKQALTHTALLFKYEGEGVAVPLVASLMRQTERLLIARSMLDQRRTSEAICGALNMGAYQCEKHFLPVVKKHSTSDLLTQMKNLCKLETQVKGPAQSKRTLVELAVHQLATG